MASHDSPQSTEIEELLSALADTHCRAVLRYFRDASKSTATVNTLAREIDYDDGDTGQGAIRLHHCTLPRLAAAGVIDYDPSSNTARYQGNSHLETLVGSTTER